ncbi:hypothetical protein GPA27_12715 [Aromatoleum toluolicum]|uniref:Transposase n=1 Tax=Aromatoleum toluolicum TaxID=90060 RepID=A0ABX1NG15_9RHOO|nr:hypothetical protein [Aromatoleum toluolicum]NMF98247.1 hypothetical protein [Aromatoleum toluolicum]
MTVTTADDDSKGVVIDRESGRGAVSPLRFARDRGVTAMSAAPTIDTHHPNDIYRSAHRHACPRCMGSVYRVPRRFVDLLLSVFVPVHRYRCDEMGCTWEGNLRTTRQSGPSGGTADTHEEAGSDAHERSQMGRDSL